MKLEIHNSFCKLTGNIPQEVKELVKQVLTYRNDIDGELGQLFFQLKQSKRFNNDKMYRMTLGRIKALKDSEWVCWFRNDSFPTGHLNIVRAALWELQTSFVEVDLRKIPSRSLVLKWENKPPEMRYYQKEMVALGLKEGRGVFESCVGSGKSMIMANIIKELQVTALVIVPSIGLSLQLENDFKVWFGEDKVETVTTARVRAGKPLKSIRIATIQTLASLQKSGELQKVVRDVNSLHVDETHHSASKSYLDLLTEIPHIYYRFGYSGTFLRNDSKSLDMWGFLSNVLYRYPAHKAIEEGFLTPIEVNVFELPGKPNRSYPKEYDNNYCGSQVLLNKVLDICKNAGDHEQILILVKNKDKAGLIFHEFLKMNSLDNMYLSGDDKKEVVNNTIKAFNDKRFRILIGSSVIGEGINVQSTDSLIMCQGGKSEIVIVQAVGRAVRLFKGKKIAKIFDFDFLGTKFLRKHLTQRKDVYDRNFECQINTISSD